MNHLKYRSDIDGLRAVAVLGVIIYHAFPQALPGGFIGVDIFFVISGYLISGILYKGGREGEFTFREFYARRIRRLFPSLIAVLTLCLVYGYFVLLRHEYEQLGQHVAAGALFIQNIVFWQESGYFDTAAILKPLLHLWSLAVEEQFYIFFPPLLLLIWKRRWPMASLLWGMLVVSLAANIWMSYHGRDADFFLTPFRAWEFLAGSLLAWWHYGKSHEDESPYGNLLSAGGGILLILGMVLIHQGSHFPGWRAILPVAGTVMLIMAGRGSWINKWILSHPVAVWIGLISYPLYLFHWPALSFVHIIKGEYPSPIYVFGALAVALVLTISTYYLVEKPVRFSKSKSTIWALFMAFAVVGIFGWIIWRKGIRAGTTADVERVAFAIRNRGFFEGWTMQQKEKEIWLSQAGAGDFKTLYLGDSNMWQYAPRIIRVLNDGKHRSAGVIILGAGNTLPIEGVEVYENKRVENLLEQYHQLLDTDSGIRRVVITAAWDKYFKGKGFKDILNYSINGHDLRDTSGEKEAIANLGCMICSLKKAAKDVVLILSVPGGEQFNPQHFFHRSFFGIFLTTPPVITKKDFLEKIGDRELRKDLALIAKENGAAVIDPLDYLTDGENCLVVSSDGNPIRYDDLHLRSWFVRDHVRYLDWTIGP